MNKKWLILTLIIALLLLMSIFKSKNRKVRFGQVQVQQVSKVDNFEPVWRQNMSRNRRIVQIEKIARQMGILDADDYLDFTHTKSDNDITVAARKHGLIKQNEFLRLI